MAKLETNPELSIKILNPKSRKFFVDWFRLPVPCWNHESEWMYFCTLHDHFYDVEHKLEAYLKEFNKLGSSVEKLRMDFLENISWTTRIFSAGIPVDTPPIPMIPQTSLLELLPTISNNETVVIIQLQDRLAEIFTFLGHPFAAKIKELGTSNFLRSKEISECAVLCPDRIIENLLLSEIGGKINNAETLILQEMAIELKEIGCQLSFHTGGILLCRFKKGSSQTSIDMQINMINRAGEKVHKSSGRNYIVERNVLKVPPDSNFIIRERDSMRVEFINVPSSIASQVLKYHFNIPLEEKDIFYETEDGILLKHETPLFGINVKKGIPKVNDKDKSFSPDPMINMEKAAREQEEFFTRMQDAQSKQDLDSKPKPLYDYFFEDKEEAKNMVEMKKVIKNFDVFLDKLNK